MAGENPEEIYTPSRRALLKAAAAGGVFAVPLIASFSMDAASAQTRAQAFGSSNQVIITSNQFFCSNMTGVPTAVFYAELRQVNSSGVPAGPVVGLAGFEFVHGSDKLFYELLIRGTLFDFIVYDPDGAELFEDRTSSKAGAIPGSAFNCAPGTSGVATVFAAFAAGGSSVEVDLADGTELLGTIVRLDPSGPRRGAFRFVGTH